MVDVLIDSESISDDNKKYFKTKENGKIASFDRFQSIVVEGKEFFNHGIQWENLGLGEDEITYYIYNL